MTNAVLENIKSRRSVRKYKPDMVPDDLLNKVIEAGTFAPSGRGRQPSVIIAIKNKELRDRIAKLNGRIWGDENFDTFYGAPVILLVAATNVNNTAVYDGSLVLQNMMLAAHSLGLGSCWIHRCVQSMEDPLYIELFKSLGLDAKDYIGVGHLALGYANGELPKAAPRKENYSFIVE